jgi:hypothetical protein
LSRRIQIVLPDPSAELLRNRAAEEGVAHSTLAAQLVRERLHSGSPTSTRRAPHGTALSEKNRRPDWLEPYGSSGTWRAETWGTIVALHARYPKALGSLRDGWWENPSHLEMLCALAAWRAQIDSCGHDPREELAFHSHLDDYAQQLRSESGGAMSAWGPGAPPAGWSRNPTS